jgi:hypothetical protein
MKSSKTKRPATNDVLLEALQQSSAAASKSKGGDMSYFIVSALCEVSQESSGHISGKDSVVPPRAWLVGSIILNRLGSIYVVHW